MTEYFKKNQAIFSPEEMALLADKKILVAGCGGLGGSVIELLSRSGIGHLIVADGDQFEPSNMNRQLLCTTDTLGRSKAEEAAGRILSINPDADVRTVCCRLDRNNLKELLPGCDLVIDALDSVSSRLMLEDACAEEGLFLIHGAVNGWFLQAGICPPGAGMLHTLYASHDPGGPSGGGIAMTVFTCAAFEVSEAIKLLLHRPDTLTGKLVFFDLLSKESEVVSLGVNGGPASL